MKDVNDHDPIFTQKKYNFNVSENDSDEKRRFNVSVGKVIANDTDKHSSIVYRIVTSDVESLFDVTQVRFMSYIFFFTWLNTCVIVQYICLEYLNFACRTTNVHNYLISYSLLHCNTNMKKKDTVVFLLQPVKETFWLKKILKIKGLIRGIFIYGHGKAKLTTFKLNFVVSMLYPWLYFFQDGVIHLIGVVDHDSCSSHQFSFSVVAEGGGSPKRMVRR